MNDSRLNQRTSSPSSISATAAITVAAACTPRQCGGISKHADILRRRIEDAFRPSAVRESVDVDAAGVLVGDVKSWIECIVTTCIEPPSSSSHNSRRRDVTDALALLLRALDDADVENVRRLRNQRRVGRDGSASGVSSIDMTRTRPGDDGLASCKKRRVPSKVRSLDVVRAMHDDSADIVNPTDDDGRLPTFYLSNSDRAKRARRSNPTNGRRGHSMMGTSMRAAMNVRVPTIARHEVAGIFDNTGPITALPMDAVDARRQLYRRLAYLDTSVVGSMTDRGSGSVIGEELRSAIQIMTSDLLRRVEAYPKSPSMRLSVVIALDSICDIMSRECSFDSILDELLDANSQLSMEFHAEILSESRTHEDPPTLLRVLNKLMRRTLGADSSHDGTPSLLRVGLTKILVCRQSILAVFNQDAMRTFPLLKSDLDEYNRLCDRMSARFGSVSNWIFPSMEADEMERSISALQATGILSFFCRKDDVNQDDTLLSSLKTEACRVDSSLRSTRERMGPLDAPGRMFSHPKTYDRIIRIPDASLASTEACTVSPLSRATDDVLIAIFSFLGFRSLARASTCCVSWKRAGDAPTLWITLYFRKYHKAIFEEELLDLDMDLMDRDANAKKCIPKSSAAERHRLAASKRDHDWKRIFSSKYATDKRCRRAKSCSVVGCLHVSSRSTKTHMKGHKSAARAQRKKFNDYVALQNRCSLVMDRQNSTLEASNFQPEIPVREPEAIMKHLVFSYLDYTDLSKPICKLWTRLARCNMLWKALYVHHFGETSTQLSYVGGPHDWKLIFRSTHLANSSVRGLTNKFGWPLRVCSFFGFGCNQVLYSEFECDFHRLKHKEKCILDEVKRLKKSQQSQLTKTK